MIWLALLSIFAFFVIRCEYCLIRRSLNEMIKDFDRLLGTPNRVFTNPPSQRVVKNGESTILLSN